MTTPIVSVIILSYNTKEITLTCLERLKKSIDFLGKPVEVIVVENGSDGTDKEIKKKFLFAKILKPKTNVGFAIGNNLGLKATNPKSQYLLCLNSDAYVEEDTLKKCVEFFDSHADCDVLGCKLVFANGRLQPSAGFLPNPQNITFWLSGYDLIIPGNSVHPQQSWFFSLNRQVEWVMGAFMMMKRQVYETTKGFDENYFMYGEEIEWFQRIKNAGFITWYTPTTSITHLDKASSHGNIGKGIIKEIEGLKYFTLKYYSKDWYWFKWIIKTGMYLRFIAFTLLLKGERAQAHLQAFRQL